MASLAIVETSGASGGLVVVASGGNGHPSDRIILYKGDGSIIDWFFLNGLKTLPNTGLVSGKCVFARPTNGTYTVKWVEFLRLHASYPEAVVGDGVQHYYRLGEASGTTAVDSKSGLNGTITGGVTLGVPGAFPPNTAMSFNGTNGQIVTAAASVPQTSFAVEALIKQPTVLGNGNIHACIWSNRIATGTVAGTDAMWFGTVETGGIRVLAFYYDDVVVLGAIPLGDDKVHHVALRYDFPGSVYLYVDGRFDGALSKPRVASYSSPFSMGMSLDVPQYVAFVGILDEVAVYFTQLLDIQIAEHYAFLRTPAIVVEEQVEVRPEPFVCLEMEFLGKNNGWTVVRDWRRSPGLSWHRGLPGNGVLDLVADTGTLGFTLDNSEQNSVGKVGYYSPDHANKRYGFYLNIGVRVRIGSNVRFTGSLSALDPLPGKFNQRTVSCEVTDWMGVSERTRLENLPVLVNKRGDEVFQALITSLPGSAQPDRLQIDISPDIYPYTLDRTRDEQTVMRDELYRLSSSGLSRVYTKGDGTVVYEARGRRATMSTSTDTFTDHHGFSASHDRETVINRVQATIHPRVPSDVDVVMYTIPQAMPIDAGLPLTILGPWTDPSNPETRVGAASLVTLVPGVDYKLNSKIDGTGADLTANLTVTTGLSGNATSFELSTTVAGFVVVLQQRGKPLYDYGGAVLRWEDKVSIAQYGVASQQIDMPYTADPHLALEVAQFTVYNGAFPLTNLSGFKRIVDFKNTPEVSRSIARQISDRITISDPVTGVARPFFINAIDELVGDNRIETEWLLVAADITGYWLLEVPGYTELDLTTRLAFGQIIGHTDLPHQDIHGDQVHYDVIHQDTHTDNIHVDVTHVDYVTHTDDASHQDTWNHDDVTHQDVAHSDGAHTDIAQVYWHTDVPHSDVAHQDYHQDYPHQDAPHNDVHDDVWRQTPGIDFHDHTDCRTVFSAHNDGITHYYHDHLDCMSVWYSGYSPPPSGAVHSDWNFYDSVSHYPNGPHDDYNRDTFVEHEDFHGDTHADTHNDQAHGDYTEYVVHQDNPTQWAHGDSPHTDVPHYDTTHVDVAHVDNWPHTDAATHADSAIHSDIAHTDIAHGDIAHEDIAHSDSPHQDSHADFHGDIN